MPFGLTVIVTLFVAPPTSANTIELNVILRSGYYDSGGWVATGVRTYIMSCSQVGIGDGALRSHDPDVRVVYSE